MNFLEQYLLASICNDTENLGDYCVLKDTAYHCGEAIGNIEFRDNYKKVLFKPRKQVEYISINVTMDGKERIH